MDLLTFDQCCEYLGASKKTVYGYIKAGLPFMRPLGKGKKFFDKGKVDNWLLRFESTHARPMPLVRRR